MLIRRAAVRRAAVTGACVRTFRRGQYPFWPLTGCSPLSSFRAPDSSGSGLDLGARALTSLCGGDTSVTTFPAFGTVAGEHGAAIPPRSSPSPRHTALAKHFSRSFSSYATATRLRPSHTLASHSPSRPLSGPSSSSTPLFQRRSHSSSSPSSLSPISSITPTHPLLASPVRSSSNPLSSTPGSFTRPPLFRQQCRACSFHRHKMFGTGSSSSLSVPDRVILPTNVYASFYDLVLEPHFHDFTFSGHVAINLDVREPTTSITLNCAEIEIKSSVIKTGNSSIKAVPQEPNVEDETLTFDLGEELPQGSKVTFDLEFSGVLNDKLAGFYHSQYKTKDGETHHLATTQMEPNDARRAFPCFDEPALKSVFKVTLVADKHLTCLSNMDIESEKEVKSFIDSSVTKKAVTFNPTPLMSSYLLAFVVGELNFIETDKFRVPVRVYAPLNADIEEGRMSLELAADTLAFYEEKFGSKFPLPKMDMISIPDFSAGAMENWGLITYRTSDLLVGKDASSANIQRVSETVQHELAHQWFGNLVTMDYWDGLWLNEGFATWMSWYALDKFHPDWKIWEAFVAGDYQSALGRDAFRSSHPVEVPVKRASDVNEIFDAISYNKGSSVLRMIAAFMGEDSFLEAVRLYLDRHAYGNTTTQQLWDALSEVSGQDLGKIMSTWTRETGFPVITVTEDADNKTITVRQNRFLATGDVQAADDKILYPAVLSILTPDKTIPNILFDREVTIPLDSLDFYKINHNSIGFYRTLYPEDRLKSLTSAARDGRLNEMDRIGLLADIAALANAGSYKPSTALSTVENFTGEESYYVWESILDYVGLLRHVFLFEDPEIRAGLKKFIRKLTETQAHRLGVEFSDKDGHLTQQFRARIISAAGSSENPEILGALKDMFKRYRDGDADAIHPNIKASVFSIMMEQGGTDEYEYFKKVYLDHTVADREREWALRALGFVSDRDLVKQTLDLTLSSEVRTQDIYKPLIGLTRSPVGMEMMWCWFRDNFEEIKKVVPPGLSLFSGVLELCTSSFATTERYEEVAAFFKDKDTKGYKQSVEQALEAIQSRAARVEREREDVKEWLAKGGFA